VAVAGQRDPVLLVDAAQDAGAGRAAIIIARGAWSGVGGGHGAIGPGQGQGQGQQASQGECSPVRAMRR
jgi:hypothetical protein